MQLCTVVYLSGGKALHRCFLADFAKTAQGGAATLKPYVRFNARAWPLLESMPFHTNDTSSKFKYMLGIDPGMVQKSANRNITQNKSWLVFNYNFLLHL